MFSRNLRALFVVALLIVACGGNDDNEGCGTHLGEVRCSTDKDCEGYTGFSLELLRDRDPRCVVARCEANVCAVSSYPTGALEDEVDGDCSKPACDGNGYLTTVADLDDTGKSIPCREITCSPSLVTRLASDGTSCWKPETYEDGICRDGECVSLDRDASADAGDDASLDGSDDASLDGGDDASSDGSDDAGDASTD